jgi:hypothetical protein
MLKTSMSRQMTLVVRQPIFTKLLLVSQKLIPYKNYKFFFCSLSVEMTKKHFIDNAKIFFSNLGQLGTKYKIRAG